MKRPDPKNYKGKAAKYFADLTEYKNKGEVKSMYYDGGDIPGTLAVGDVAEDLMGPKQPKSLVANVLRKAKKMADKKKNK